MRIPENKIEEIRIAANIVDVISGYVQLRKRGKNFIGLCPFHSEKTPSFTVSEEKQIYHCFGCHAGGNVFKFLMEYEKISFVEAVQELAQELGIQIEYDESQVNERQSEQEAYYDINTVAARYFSNNLLNQNEGEIARNYFKKRNIKPQTMRAFGLGYALPGWENFIEYLKMERVDLGKAVDLGLIGSNKDGRLYDKFSGRIIFPIFSPNGRVVAFAGRILENREGVAKYLNSPESLIYIKGRILYGLSHAKDEIRKLDKAILVEGYMDLLALYQNGIKNVVAVSETALTEEQVQLLSRYTKNVVLLFDADTAGIKASMRSIELLLKKDMEIKVATLPKGEDPDSYVNNYGKEKFEDIIKQAQNFLEYQSEYYENLGMFDDASKTAEAIRELVKPVALMNDELKRNLLIKSIAKKFNLRERLLESELEKVLNKTPYKAENKTQGKVPAAINDAGTGKKTLKLTDIPKEIIKIEREIVKLLFEGNNDIVELIFNHVKPEDFEVEVHQKAAAAVHNNFVNNESLLASSILEKINEESIQDYIIQITFDKHSISKNWDEIHPGPAADQMLQKYARDTILKFKVMQINRILSEHRKNIETAGSEDDRFNLMILIRDLEKEKKMIADELNDII